MAADVAVKVISANDVVNGGVVMGVDQAGNKHTIPPQINRGGDDTALHTSLNTRFDDPRYYQGDTSS